MQPLFAGKSPFENPPRIPGRIQWVKPELVCEISFAEWTQDGELRQTVFLGWRDDKKAKEVVFLFSCGSFLLSCGGSSFPGRQ
jgi:bifunctional non-homologous end joining protein LigD